MENKENLPTEEITPEVLENKQLTNQHDSLPANESLLSEEKPASEEEKQVAVQTAEVKQISKKEKDKKTLTDKFAIIFIVIGFLTMFVAYIPVISALLLALYYVILICILILTLFTLLLNEQFRNWLSGGEVVSDIIAAVIPYCPYIFGSAIGLLTISLILFCFSKKKARKIAGLALSILFIILSGIGLAIVLSTNFQ